MKVLITLLCMTTVCLALPNKRRYADNVAETCISQTIDMAKRRDVMKRSVNSHIRTAFDLTDTNNDGHITASEFASFYVKHMDMGMTRNEWKSAFRTSLPHIDRNKNGSVELEEYAAIAGKRR